MPTNQPPIQNDVSESASEQACKPTEPSKPKVFIASSTPGRRLAEKLVEALKKEDIARLRPWWTRDAFPAGAVILDALLDQAEEIDFAVVFFTPDDYADKDGNKGPRDNCVFELGLFMGALGLEPKRSILLRDKNSQLLNDLGGVIYIDLPPDTSTLSEEERDKVEEPFIKVAVETIKSSIKDLGYCFNHATRDEPRIIPKERLMDLEKRGQNLMDSDAVEVLINTTQPMELNHNLAKSVCENMSADVIYTYFFQADAGSIRFFSSLVGALAAANLDPKTLKKLKEGEKPNIAQWRELMSEDRDSVDNVLETMRNQLRIYFLPRKPHLEFCVHNANHKNEAICYLRHTADSFVEWFKGESAKYVADELRTCRFADDNSNIVFQGTQGYELYGHANQRFLKELAANTLNRFPAGALRNKASDICFGDTIKICIEK